MSVLATSKLSRASTKCGKGVITERIAGIWSMVVAFRIARQGAQDRGALQKSVWKRLRWG
jgi:hypothetical protein